MTARKPAAFRLPPADQTPPVQKTKRTTSKPRKKAVETPAPSIKITPLPDGDEQEANISPMPIKGPRRRYIRWGVILTSALGGLISLGIGLWVTQIVGDLLANHPWLGGVASALLGLAGLAAVALAGREIFALLRQRRIGRIRARANLALMKDNADEALKVQGALARLYDSRKDLAWGLDRIGEHDGDILDAEARLHLVERELMTPLDQQARALVGSTARRISILTAISPSAVVDIAFVAALNLRQLREISTLYGGRPGALGMLRLARMVLSHLVLTGGIALGEDVLNQMLGHSLMSKISSRLGEGALNGALSARIGLAAMEICRPLPFSALKSPRLKTMLGELLKTGKISPSP